MADGWKTFMLRGLSFLRSRKGITAVLAVSLLLSLFGFGVFLSSSPGEGKKETLLRVAPGESLRSVSKKLSRRGVISSPRLFAAYAAMRGEAGSLKAGTYLLTDGMTPREILRKIVSGDIYMRGFAVPEGYSVYQIAEMMERQGFFSRKAFLSRCFDRELLADLGVRGKSVEGYLAPSTYNIPPGMDEQAVISMMVRNFESSIRARLQEKAQATGMDWEKIVTLASMVEKEAKVPEERALIASVFLNRLRKGMRLQSDPTAVYGVRAFAGKVTKSDILRKSPYNTYMISSLPPGPIGNPSAAAVEAVIAPATSDYLYFVARGDGSHYFSRSLEEHNRAVGAFLKGGERNGAKRGDGIADTAGRR